jgi:hypothetical protein
LQALFIADRVPPMISIIMMRITSMGVFIPTSATAEPINIKRAKIL